jgi:DNA-directed RNA polymerase specialized sigma24 family protein
MSNPTVKRARPPLTAESFDRFLSSLHADRDQAARQYELLRRKLIGLFRWRRCLFPEELADEVFDRMLRKIADGEQIRDPLTYWRGIARKVYLEVLKSEGKRRAALDEMQQSPPEGCRAGEIEERLECLRRCLDSFTPENRELILGYYQMDRAAKIQFRKGLARLLAIPMNALRIRAHRLREKLEACVQGRMEKQSG